MSFSLVSHRPSMSRDFDWRKDLEWTKFERKPRIFARLRIKELSDSKLYSLHAFDKMVIIHYVWIGRLNRTLKQKGRSWVHETTILEVIFVTLTDKSPAVTIDIQGPQKWWRSLLFTTSKFGLLSIRWPSATRKLLFLYSQGGRLGLGKPKKKKE